MADPGRTTATPAGSTTFAGGFDAAVVRIAPYDSPANITTEAALTSLPGMMPGGP